MILTQKSLVYANMYKQMNILVFIILETAHYRNSVFKNSAVISYGYKITDIVKTLFRLFYYINNPQKTRSSLNYFKN